MLDNLTLTFFRTITSKVYPQATQLLQEAMKYFEGGWLQGYWGFSPTHQHSEFQSVHHSQVRSCFDVVQDK